MHEMIDPTRVQSGSFDSACYLYNILWESELGPLPECSLGSGCFGSVFELPGDRVIKIFTVWRTELERVRDKLTEQAEYPNEFTMRLDRFEFSKACVKTFGHVSSYGSEYDLFACYYIGERLHPLTFKHRSDVPAFIELAEKAGVKHSDTSCNGHNIMRTSAGRLKYIDLESIRLTDISKRAARYAHSRHAM